MYVCMYVYIYIYIYIYIFKISIDNTCSLLVVIGHFNTLNCYMIFMLIISFPISYCHFISLRFSPHVGNVF